ncbi:MAG: FKBP-type peptidyl-prolyl cis-trans isomerase [Gemmatimonadetes bacterium]|nr:FKBP-type peptidyl-prolyl cis-trans isomerase [Gemmatimonadota bacterium]
MPRLFLVALLLCTACRSGLPPIAASLPPAPGDLRTLYAVRAVDVAVGTGKDARPNACLYAHYTGWLTTGTKFDSSRDTMPNGKPRTPLVFRQGARQVIAGWDAGFEGMKVGGRRRLFLPYQVAYGEEGRPPTIPARSMLVFDVELMDVTDAPPVPPGTPPAQARCKPWEQR